MSRLMILPLSLLLSSLACTPTPDPVEAETLLIDYEVENAEQLATTGVEESGAEVVVVLNDFGKTDFGVLEEPYDTTLVEQDGIRISLDRDTNVITFSGEGFSEPLDVDQWVAGLVPEHGEGWCTPDPTGQWPCGEEGYYIPLEDMTVEFTIPSGTLTVWMTLVQGEWNISRETFSFGRINAILLLSSSL